MLTRADYERKTWNVNLQNMSCHCAILNNVIKESRSTTLLCKGPGRALIGSRIDGFVLEKTHGLRTITINRAESIRGFPKYDESAKSFTWSTNSFRFDIWVMHNNQNSDFEPLLALFGLGRVLSILLSDDTPILIPTFQPIQPGGGRGGGRKVPALTLNVYKFFKIQSNAAKLCEFF